MSWPPCDENGSPKMIDDVRARLASIEQRFGSRTVQRSTPPSAQNGVAFQQILGSLGPTGGPTTLGQLLESLTTAATRCIETRTGSAWLRS